MASQQLLVHMSGASPYGIRFIGGDSSPFTVAKIRPSSKAQIAGLLEGDVILAINNVCAKGISHATATGLIEKNNSGLEILVLRGRNAVSDAVSAMAALGPQFQRLTETEASALAQSQPSAGFPSTAAYNGNQPEVRFRLLAPPSGGSLKQMRLAKSEVGPITGTASEGGFAVQSVEKPDFYSREERSSTDGGRTTRIVEEVKKENVGGTTLTKVTKQEFTSYAGSSNHLPAAETSLQPSYSMIRSQEEGRPVLLGAPSRDVENGGSVRDERGWSMTTSVQSNSVRSQPYHVQVENANQPCHIQVNSGSQPYHVQVNSGSQPCRVQVVGAQEPAQSWTVHGKEPTGGYLVGAQTTSVHPAATIEIQFEPNVTGFGGSSNANLQRLENETNFQVKVGNEVSFQPKFHQTLQSHVQNQPSAKTYATQEMKTGPQAAPFVNDSVNSERPNYQFIRQGEHQFYHEPTNRPLYGHSEAPIQGSQAQSYEGPRAAHQSVKDINRDNNPDYRFMPDIQIRPDYREAHETPFNSSTQNQFQHNASSSGYGSEVRPQPRSGDHPQFDSRPDHESHGYRPESSGVHSHLGYKLEPAPSEIHPPFGYRAETEPSKVHNQFGHRSEPLGIRPHSGYRQEPEPKTEPTGVHRQMGYTAEPSVGRSPFGYRPDADPPGIHSQFGYKTEPEKAYGIDTNVQYHQKPETHYKPVSHAEFGQRTEPQPIRGSAPAPSSYSFYEQTPEQQFPTEGQTARGEAFPANYLKKASYNSQEPLNNEYPRLGHPLTKSVAPNPAPLREMSLPPSAPSTYPQDQNIGSWLPAYGRANDTPNKWSGKFQNKGGVERVEIGGAQKWVPGSKLPLASQQPARPQPASDFSWNRNEVPARGQGIEDEIGYVETSKNVWNDPAEAVVGGVALSRIYEPKRHAVETAECYGMDDSREATELPGYGQRAPLEHQPFAGRYGQPEQAVVGYPETFGPGHCKNVPDVWRPSGFDHQHHLHRDVYQQEDGNESSYYTQNDAYSHEPLSAPPPPAPPLLPHMPISPSVQAPTPLTPPPPPAAPPIDHLKVYRGANAPDRGHGYTTLEQRVKVANSMALSVLAPENRNSKGQKMFIRRRENSDKWTTQGPDPVPETPQQHNQEARNPNVWSPAKPPGFPQMNPPARHPLTRPAAPNPAPFREMSLPPSAPSMYSQDQDIGSRSSAYSLANDMVLNSGRGGKLFAKKRATADKWSSEESNGRQEAPQLLSSTTIRQTGYGQHELQVPANSVSYRPATSEGEGGGGQPIVNRLKSMIQPKSSAGQWNSAIPQMAPYDISDPYGQATPGGTWPRGRSLSNSQTRKATGFSSSYQPVKFQGPSAISSLAPPIGQPQNASSGVRFASRQFGVKAIGQGHGCTDL